MEYLLQNIQNIPSLFQIQLPVSKDYEPVIYDISRAIVIQLCIHIFYSLITPEHKIFSPHFLKIFFFMIIGIMFYWLIFKKLIRFNFKDNNNDIKKK